MSEADHTYTIPEGAARVVMGDTQNAFASVDDALISGTRLLGSIIETTKSSDLPVGITQKLFTLMAKSVNTMLSSRSDMVTTLALMEQIRDRSTVRELADGCTRPWWQMGDSEMGEIATTECATAK